MARTLVTLTLTASTLAVAAAAHAQAPQVILPSDRQPVRVQTPGSGQAPVVRPSTPTAPRTVAPAATAPAARVDGADVLLRQARTWRERGRPDLATQALTRAVAVSPRNPQVLYLLALYTGQDGDLTASAGWLDRLRLVTKPGDGRVAEVDRLLRARGQAGITIARTNTTAPVAVAPPDTPPIGSAAPLPPPPTAIVDTAGRVPVPTPVTEVLPPPSRSAIAPEAPREAAAPPAATRTAERRPSPSPKPVANPDPGGEARADGFRALNAGRLGEAETLFQRALSTRASDTDAAGGLGIVRLRQQRFAEAERLLDQASRGPNPGRWRDAIESAQFFGGMSRVRAAIDAGRLPEAEATARRLAGGAYKDRAEAQLALGEILSRQRRYQEAEVVYRDVFLRSPDRVEAVAGLAEALSQLGRTDEAARLFDRLPRTPATLEARARIERTRATDMQQRGDSFGAGSALAAALAANPRDPWTRYDYARFLIGLGQVSQATEVAAPLFANANADGETLQAAALYADFAGRPDQAAAILQRIPPPSRNAAVRELAERVDAKNVIARAQAMQRAGQTVQAVATLRDFVARTRLPFGTRAQIAQALLEMGDTYQAGSLALTAAREPVPADARPGDALGFVAVLAAGGQDAAANALLQQLAQRVRTPEDQAAWRQAYAIFGAQRADALRTAGDLAGAFDMLSAAFAVAPRDPGLMAALARLYAGGGMAREAAQAYDALLTLRPDDAGVLLDAARAATSAEDWDRAARLMQRAARLKPNDPELFYEIGRMEQARGRDRAALAAFERAEGLIRGMTDPRLPRPVMPGGMLGPNPFARAAAPAQQRPVQPAFPFMGTSGAGEPAGFAPPRFAYAAPPPQQSFPQVQSQMYVPPAPPPQAYAQPAPQAYYAAPSQQAYDPGPQQYAQAYPQQAYAQANDAFPATPQPAFGTGGGASIPANRQAPAPQPTWQQPPPMQPAPQAYPAYPPQAGFPAQAPMAYPPLPAPQAGAFPAPAFPQAQAPVYAAPPSGPFGAVPVPQVPQAVAQQPAFPGGFGQPQFAQPVQPRAQAVDPLPAGTTVVPDVDQPLLGSRATAATDPSVPLAVRIRSEIAAARLDDVAVADAGFTGRLRSGEQGTSRLAEAGGTVAVSVPIAGVGQLALSVRPVAVIAGVPTNDTLSRIGGYPLLIAQAAANGETLTLPVQRGRSDAGVAPTLSFTSGWLRADVGYTPYGFRFGDVVGGVRLTPRIGPLELRLAAEQRAVEDSLLAWSGERDAVTNIAWGGVRRQSGSAGVSLSLDAAGAYVDGTFKRFRGTNVQTNDAVEVNGGFYYRPINDLDRRLQIGLNVNYQGYDRNLRYFTLGHGGYFSPQEFIAASIPINFLAAGNDWRLAINLTPGIQSYTENVTPIFPGFTNLQSQLVTLALADPTVAAFYPGTSRTGFGLAGRVSGEYRIQPRTTAGGLLSLDTFGAYSEFRLNLYLRQQIGFGR